MVIESLNDMNVNQIVKPFRHFEIIVISAKPIEAFIFFSIIVQKGTEKMEEKCLATSIMSIEHII